MMPYWGTLRLPLTFSIIVSSIEKMNPIPLWYGVFIFDFDFFLGVDYYFVDMLFNSIAFLIFFCTVTPLYFILPQRFRWGLLLLASCYFYMAFIPWYILVLFCLIVFDYIFGIQIEKTQGKKRKLWLYLSIFSNIGALFVFKYFNFFNENLSFLFEKFHLSYPVNNLSLALPLGLSFHTFQSLAYVIEVYKGNTKAERHLGIYALYVMFFPQLVAGPIERPNHMLPQFRVIHYFSFSRFVLGAERMMWGFFKKIVVADHLAVLVNIVYGSPTEFSGPSLVLATIYFAFQIYCDFSGYCDIAIGAAQILGFDLSENFNTPYFSSSMSEFWRRWHMSLSAWFRDYVYIPLGGSRSGEMKIAFNLFLTFLLSGLWHGASWTFIMWGGLNGVYLIFGRLKKKYFEYKKVVLWGLNLSVLGTFFFTCFAWIFFRASTVSEAWYIVSHLHQGWLHLTESSLWNHVLYFDRIDTDFFLALFGIGIVIFVEYSKNFLMNLKILFHSSFFIRTIFYTMLFIFICTLWEGRGTEFIYFQF